MLLYIPNENHQTLVFFDTEFDDRRLVQVAMIIYEQITLDGIKAYLLKGSINLYFKKEVTSFFTKYTNIKQSYLDQHGIEEEEGLLQINTFLKDLNNSHTMFISHGVKQDMDLILTMGVGVDKVERYCTYDASKRLLNRTSNLRLIDVCNDSGYFADQHDAYTDAKNVVHAFSYLKLIEATEK